MSEIARVLNEFGATEGQVVGLSIADRQLIQDALRQYAEHLMITATTVRTVKPSPHRERVSIAAYLDTQSARASLLANVIDISGTMSIVNCGGA